MSDARHRLMKILNPKLHGFVDYTLVLLVALAPTLFGFGGLPQILCYVLAALHLASSLFTAYPLGAVKLIPFPVHGLGEGLLAPLLALVPWLLGFWDVAPARNFFLIVAGAIALVWLITDYKLEVHKVGQGGPSHA
jgi:hypothetical protein